MRYRTIRIDEQVWAELERRISGFKDNPNRVLRRIIGLEEEVSENEGDTTDKRVPRLLGLAGFSADEPIRRTKIGSTGIVSKSGTTFGYVYPQKSRLKVEVRKDWAEKAGLDNWDYELPRGWFNTDISSVYWYVPDGDDGAYHAVGSILAKLRNLE